MHDIGAFFAEQGSLPGVADEKLLARGQALYRGGDAALGVPACMACHGPDGRGMAGAGYPQLAGQWADYVQAKLKDLKNGTTWGDDGNAKIMPPDRKASGRQRHRCARLLRRRPAHGRGRCKATAALIERPTATGPSRGG